MPSQDITIFPTGKINRRDPAAYIDQSEVRMRQNMLVIGNGDNKQVKKMPGSDRYTNTTVDGLYTWASRYYSAGITKTFAFAKGSLYYIASDGTPTNVLGVLNQTARPVSEIMKISDNNVMYLSDGFNGMYSHDGNIANTWNKEATVTLNFVHMISHLDRMFGIEENSEDLYFSANLQPYNYTDSNDAGLITIGAKRGAKIQALVLLNETLYIFKEDSVFVLEGRTPSEFRVRQIHGVPGTPARFSVVNVESGIIYMDQSYEFREFNGVTSKILSYNIAIGGDLTKDLPSIINKNLPDNVVACFHNNLYRCAFTESGAVANNLEYILNTINLTDSITRGNNVNCYSIWDKTPDHQELITGRSDASYLMYQYRGLNYDNQNASSSMPIILDSRVNAGVNNARYKRLWASVNILGEDVLTVKTAVDTRLSTSNQSTNSFESVGEKNSITNFLTVNNQENMTDRVNLPMSNSKGQSLMIRLEQDKRDLDVSLIAWNLEVIVKEKKRRKHVGI